MRKTLSLFLLTILSAAMLGGCLNPIQLNERAIVQAVGIDWDGKNIRMTFQVFSPAVEGGGGISATADNAKIIEASGNTVSEAVQNAMMVQGKQLFVGHNRIVILGAELAKRGLEQPLSYFSANAWSRQGVYLAVASDTANEILTAKINQGILPAETLEKIVQNAEDNGAVRNVRLYEFLEALQNKNESSFLPIMKLKGGETGASGLEGENGGKPQAGQTIDEVSSIEMAGTAVFSDAKLQGELGKDASRGLLFIRDDMKQTVIVTQTDNFETAALRIFKSKSRLTPSIDGSDISFTLEISCEATIGETMIREGKSTEALDIEQMSKAGEQIIREECAAAFQKAAVEYQSDIFGFGNILWQKDSDEWKKLQEDWPEALSQITLHVNPHIDIDRMGLEVE